MQSIKLLTLSLVLAFGASNFTKGAGFVEFFVDLERKAADEAAKIAADAAKKVQQMQGPKVARATRGSASKGHLFQAAEIAARVSRNGAPAGLSLPQPQLSAAGRSFTESSVTGSMLDHCARLQKSFGSKTAMFRQGAEQARTAAQQVQAVAAVVEPMTDSHVAKAIVDTAKTQAQAQVAKAARATKGAVSKGHLFQAAKSAAQARNSVRIPSGLSLPQPQLPAVCSFPKSSMTGSMLDHCAKLQKPFGSKTAMFRQGVKQARTEAANVVSRVAKAVAGAAKAQARVVDAVGNSVSGFDPAKAVSRGLQAVAGAAKKQAQAVDAVGNFVQSFKPVVIKPMTDPTWAQRAYFQAVRNKRNVVKGASSFWNYFSKPVVKTARNIANNKVDRAIVASALLYGGCKLYKNRSKIKNYLSEKYNNLLFQGMF